MKPFKSIWPVLIGACLCGSAAAHAQQDVSNQLTNQLANQFTLSARFGFNISAGFKGLSALPLPSSTRKTPQGDAYNYDDGYVLTDNTGNFGGQTWYWGYDNSARQISGNNILMSRNSLAGGTSSASLDNDPSYGAELVYRRLLVTKKSLSFGLELAANYLNLSLSDSSTLAANVLRTSYPYAFTPGTVPPAATPHSPYQGSPEGPGFVISDTPGTPTTTTVIGGASIQGNRQFDADIWGLRFGPYLELPVGRRLRLSLSGGLAGGWLDGNASWTETLSVGGVSGAPLSGNGHADEMLWGFYAGATASYQFSQRWSAVAGVQYQDLQNFNHSFGGRQVEVKLSESLFVTVGVGLSF